MDPERFDGLVRSIGQARSRRGLGRLLGGLGLGGVLSVQTVLDAAAALRNGGDGCSKGGHCKTGRCLGSGKCSCSAKYPACKQPANPCQKAACDTGRNRCKTTNQKNGVACGDGKFCQDGACGADTRTVGVSFESFDQNHTHCYVTVEAAGFAQGAYPGSVGFVGSSDRQEFTVEVGAAGTGSWASKSISLIWPSGSTVEALVDGVSSGAVPVTC